MAYHQEKQDKLLQIKLYPLNKSKKGTDVLSLFRSINDT